MVINGSVAPRPIVNSNDDASSAMVAVVPWPSRLIKVKDTGCGIPKEYQRIIFQAFFRVDKSRSREYGGVGLGLSLVWEIAELHGGKVYVEESSNEGTTIVVKFPA